jgi:hypothetical protein
MSTDYRPLKDIQMADVFDGRLQEFNIHEPTEAQGTSRKRCLTDGFNYVWAFGDDDGRLTDLTRYAHGGNPTYILNTIARAFDSDIVSEYEPQYWGFDTEKEWDAWQAGIAAEYEDHFHLELLKFLAGEPCDSKSRFPDHHDLGNPAALYSPIPPSAMILTWAASMMELVVARHVFCVHERHEDGGALDGRGRDAAAVVRSVAERYNRHAMGGLICGVAGGTCGASPRRDTRVIPLTVQVVEGDDR